LFNFAVMFIGYPSQYLLTQVHPNWRWPQLPISNNLECLRSPRVSVSSRLRCFVCVSFWWISLKHLRIAGSYCQMSISESTQFERVTSDHNPLLAYTPQLSTSQWISRIFYLAFVAFFLFPCALLLLVGFLYIQDGWFVPSG
jgi:hypothetical protein